MLVVDSQVHIWGADTPERPWPKRAPPQRPIPLGADDLLREMNEAGVDRVIIVPPSWEGDRNDLGVAAAAAHPNRYAVMGRLDPQDPKSRGQLAMWRKQPGMLGLRFTFHIPELVMLLTEGHMDWVWGDAEKYGVPIYVLVPQPLVHLIDKVAHKYPGLKLTMDHLSIPSGKKDAEAFKDLDLLLAIAKRPNVAAKVSALPCYSTAKYPYTELHGHIRRAYDAFGPQRLFWGSDQSRSPIPYRQQVTMFTEEIPWLTANDKDWIMGRGVCEWLGWKI
ncbi:MAG TPA: amidohydrolase family protein [Burkholderiales bacterium]|nr:amidohydrolase family protein [Burkholderiales bacterium]